MNALALCIGIPAAGAIVAASMPGHRLGALVTSLASLASFAAGMLLFDAPRFAGDYFILDDANALFIALNSFVAFTTSVFSVSYVGHEVQNGRLTPMLVRFYHAMFLAIVAAMNLALASNNIGLLWVGLEFATLITVVMVGLYRTPAAIEAAWKYFILGSVGISLAFFGTILIYLAGQAALGEGLPAMTWSRLLASGAQLDPALVNLAFVFLLVGYGTKVGLFPMHAWLPDAHSEGPTPIAAVLSGLMLNVALFALLRFKMIAGATPGALDPGPLMMIMGLATLLFASIMLFMRRDIKRLFAYSSIEHMGLIVFAFGMGGAVASFGALLHMAMHSLTKSAIFFAVGHVAQAKGTQEIARIRGLSVSHPLLALGLAAGVLAIAGLPPSGVFMSEFLIVTSAFARHPLIAVLPALGLFLAFAALLWRLQDMLFGEPTLPNNKVDASYLPLAAHLLAVLAAGLYIPGPVAIMLQRAAEMLK